MVAGPDPIGRYQSDGLVLDKHQHFIEHLDDDKFTLEYLMTDNLRMGGLYWALCALDVLNKLDTPNTEAKKDEWVEWVRKCQHENGGFGANIHHRRTHYGDAPRSARF